MSGMAGTIKPEQGAAAATRHPYARDNGVTPVVDIMGIIRSLPQRYPFLLVDRVIDIVHGQSAIGIKNVTINEEFFQGHFPHYPVMPGVLVIEAFAQTGAVLAVETLGGPEVTKELGVFFMSVESAKFRRPIIPGDQVRMHVRIERKRGPVWRFKGVGRVDEHVVAESMFTFMVVPRDRQGDPRPG
jgi:3-hydroxyacyl-[acyl-carrier-protein] dehydratase